jgi:hypothetical protein
METIRVLGIDPSLRNSGMGIVEYNTETEKFSVDSCLLLTNPQSYKGTEAILNMLDMMHEAAEENECFRKVDAICVESPAILFNKNFSGGALISVAHVTGGAAAIFDLEKTHLFRPGDWNKSRKKEVTHRKTVGTLGDPDSWHYLKRVKTQNGIEHILDAVSMALFYIRLQVDE